MRNAKPSLLLIYLQQSISIDLYGYFQTIPYSRIQDLFSQDCNEDSLLRRLNEPPDGPVAGAVWSINKRRGTGKPH